MSLTVREKIIEILKELMPDLNLSSKDLMKEEGVESLMMIQLISELDLAFDIEITFEDILNDHFHSVDAIEEMVLGYLR